MNAGAYGGEMKDVLTTVRYLAAEGEVREVPAAELDLAIATAFLKRTAAASSRHSSICSPGTQRTSVQKWMN